MQPCFAGTVMVFNEMGKLKVRDKAYDKKVIGVVSGAGKNKPAIILDSVDSLSQDSRIPIAVMGKAYCQVDASYSPVLTKKD